MLRMPAGAQLPRRTMTSSSDIVPVGSSIRPVIWFRLMSPARRASMGSAPHSVAYVSHPVPLAVHLVRIRQSWAIVGFVGSAVAVLIASQLDLVHLQA